MAAGSEVVLLTSATLPAVALMLKPPLKLAAGNATPALPPLPSWMSTYWPAPMEPLRLTFWLPQLVPVAEVYWIDQLAIDTGAALAL